MDNDVVDPDLHDLQSARMVEDLRVGVVDVGTRSSAVDPSHTWMDVGPAQTHATSIPEVESQFCHPLLYLGFWIRQKQKTQGKHTGKTY